MLDKNTHRLLKDDSGQEMQEQEGVWPARRTCCLLKLKAAMNGVQLASCVNSVLTSY